MNQARTTRSAPSPLPGLYADPALVVYGDRYWLYPTTDGSEGWAATSFSVFSSHDLVEWQDHGLVLSLPDDVRWATDRAWAPAAAERDGRYYLYFTAGGGHIGVASADHPAGPFIDHGRPLVADGDFEGVAIDPSVFLDDDGTWYLLWGNGVAHLVPLGDDMMSFDRRQVISWIPTGFREAITVHRRDGLYYASWSENDTRDPEYRVRYATADALTGPWRDRGVLIEQDPDLGLLATGHHSITHIPDSDDWLVAYHRFALDNGTGYRREILFDRLEHAPDGSLSVRHDPRGFRLPLDGSVTA
ncbi:beta-xylosidase [Clavibacter michiganensis]|uniref:family 43 glycosylhydrolase n=1 Tax=Clavibacter michiganensis TaxID=28447 RepID=UPI000CE79DF7|nr:family 43 glycosylhydrolase [Clavibacter michiganensis]PPF56469.1 beta-xylosidase [Clavibacter michiganensis]